VQKDNQEETIINQDARLLLEAIRSGAGGMNYLTNYFERITVDNQVFNGEFVELARRQGNRPFLTNGLTIVGLLSNPKYLPQGNLIISNRVTARVRAISGAAIEKSASPIMRDIAFRYRLTSELIPLNVFPRELTNFTATGLTPLERQVLSNNWLTARNQAVNFHELRLTLQGPVIPQGTNFNVYGTPRTFRTLVSGRLDPVGPPGADPPYLWLVQPNAYARVNP
jgi:hypothetical protein